VPYFKLLLLALSSTSIWTAPKPGEGLGPLPLGSCVPWNIESNRRISPTLTMSTGQLIHIIIIIVRLQELEITFIQGTIIQNSVQIS
jgi:hypothetical protein